jgi:hypothetical protein
MNYSIRLVVVPVALFILSSVLSGCATAEHGRRITPDQITWIQKGITTRAEILQKLGGPMSEVPDWGGITYQSTSVTTTIKEGDTQKTVTTTTAQPTKQRTKALYLYTRAEAAAFVGVKTTQEKFWVIYDEHGVVQDFSFEGAPSMTVR